MAINPNKAKARPPGAGGPDIGKSRRAAGINVAVSIVVAAGLLVAVNVAVHLVSDKWSLRGSVETLGQYGLSQTTRTILSQVNQPVRLTSIYTSLDSEKDPEEYLPRVRSTLSEMRQWHDDLTVVNIATDQQKAEVVERLRDRLNEAAAEHRKLVNDFRKLVTQQAPVYEQEGRTWGRYPADGWLAQFGIAKSLEQGMTALAGDLEKKSGQYGQEQEGTGLPDYPAMTGDLHDTLEGLEGGLRQLGDQLRELASLPAKAQAASAKLTAAAADCVAKVDLALASLGAEGSPLPEDPNAALGAFTDNATAAALAARTVLAELGTLSSGAFARYARAWRTPSGSLPEDYAALVELAEGLSQETQSIRSTFTVDKQKETIPQIRQYLARAAIAENALDAQKALARLLGDLSNMDDATRQVLTKAEDKEYFEELLTPIRELLARCRDLPDLTDQRELIDNIKEDNIVLGEVGDKTGVVGFDDVWPVARQDFEGQGDQEVRRVFNGDMAVASKILTLSARPFAEIVLTYFEDVPEGQMRQYRPPVEGAIPSSQLQTVRERLEGANLVVTDWNLQQSPRDDDDIPLPPENVEGLPRVLLVLPPPNPMPAGMTMPLPEWTDKEEQAVTRLVEGGTPAIFLAGYFFPRFMFEAASPPYGLADYLSGRWGLDVMTGSRVMQTVRNSAEVGTYQIPVRGFNYMTASTFIGSHPVGKPLRARRFYWRNACPVVPAKDSQVAATIRNILIVPEGADGMWATSDVEGLIAKAMEATALVPDPKTDLMPEFPLAVEADRKLEDGKQARIIVIGMGESFADGYLQSPIRWIREDGTIGKEPPPAGNADLLVNSAYHLAGKESYIAAGPAVVKPISLSPASLSVVKLVFGLGWPAVVLGIGVVVLLIRKR